MQKKKKVEYKLLPKMKQEGEDSLEGPNQNLVNSVHKGHNYTHKVFFFFGLYFPWQQVLALGEVRGSQRTASGTTEVTYAILFLIILSFSKVRFVVSRSFCVLSTQSQHPVESRSGYILIQLNGIGFFN